MGLLTTAEHWGDLRGVIRLTGTDAYNEFGFTTKQGAEGVVFRRYNYVTSGGVPKTGIFVNNYIPRVDPHTPAQNTNRRDRFGILSRIVNTNRNIFYYIWQTLADKHCSNKAHWGNEFRSTNMKLIGTPPDFTKMLLSNGMLEPTQQILSFNVPVGSVILTISFDSSTYHNGKPTDIVYTGIFDDVAKTFEIPVATKMWLRRDTQFIGILSKPYTKTNLIAFVYFSQGCSYSLSSSLHG